MEEGVTRAERVAKALGVLFAETRIPVIALTRPGQLVAANAAAVSQYGWSLQELVRMNIRDLINTDYPSLDDDLERAFAGTERPLRRRPHRRKDGSELWVVPTAGPVVVDGETLIVSVLKDVTAIIDAEQQARDATDITLRDRQLVLNAVVAMLGERELRPALQVLARSFGEAIGRSTTVWLPERKGSRVLRAVAWHELTEEGERTISAKKIDLDRERFARRAWDTGVGYAIDQADLEPGTVEHATVARLGPAVVAPLMGRAGAHGKASTFATRAERADISRIERALATRLERRPVPTDILREEKQTAPVIVIPSAGLRQPQVRSFGPRSKFGRRPARRAI